MRVLTLLSRTLAAIAAVRVGVLFTQLWLGTSGVHAYHVESAAAVFAALAALAWWAGSAIRRRVHLFGKTAINEPDVVSPKLALPIFVATSLALFATALPVGLLSDDFILISKAHDWQLGAVASYAFRPIAMGLWALFDHAGVGVAVFHAFIVILHGVLAFLTVRLASGWTTSTWAPLLAGALLLTFPVTVEPVVWLANGFENVTMAVFVLLAVLVSRRYGDRTAPGDRILCAALVIAAVLAKETGAVAGALILVDAFARGRLTRTLWIDAGILTSAGACYGALRLIAATDAPAHEVSAYTFQRTVFQTFGGLAQQWPATSHALSPYLAIVSVTSLLLILLAATLDARRDTARTVAAAVAWSFISVMPVFGWILIGSNLRDSRWLYLAAPAWAAGLAAMVDRRGSDRSAVRAASILVAIVLIALNVVAVRWQIGAWVRAGDLRDRVLQALNQNSDVRACSSIRLTGLPENEEGAYVLLNGAAQAWARIGTAVPIDPSSPAECRFRWTGAAIVRGE